MNTAVVSNEPEDPPRRTSRRRWPLGLLAIALAGLVALAIVANYCLQHAGPLLRTRVIQTLSARFHAPVELDTLNISLVKGILVEGDGLRIPYASASQTLPPGSAPNAKARPLIGVDHFTFRTHLKGLLHEPIEIGIVQVQGMVIDLPTGAARSQILGGPSDPGGPANTKPGPRLGFTAMEIDATGSKLLIESADPRKEPMTFDLSSIRLTHVDTAASLDYDAQISNPLPRGIIHATGHFGPWNAGQPRQTALNGDYTFHADLSSINGIAGALASTGRFSGPLERLTADGTADVPNFSLDISNHPLPLKTTFHAIINATTGDTQLDPVDGWLRHTHILASGLVQKVPHQGHDIALTVSVPSGRIEDILELGMKSTPPVMRAPVTLKATLHIRPGKVRVAAKLELAGTLSERDIVFGNPKVQDKIDSLSMRAQGRPEEAAAAGSDRKTEVNSQLAATFRLAHGQGLFESVTYEVPGAHIELKGAYLMDRDRYDFRGHVRTDAKASQMVTGWKSLLLKPMDRLLAKNGAGMQLPLEIAGEKKNMHFGLALLGRADATPLQIAQEMLQQPTAAPPAAASTSPKR